MHQLLQFLLLHLKRIRSHVGARAERTEKTEGEVEGLASYIVFARAVYGLVDSLEERLVQRQNHLEKMIIQIIARETK